MSNPYCHRCGEICCRCWRSNVAPMAYVAWLFVGTLLLFVLLSCICSAQTLSIKSITPPSVRAVAPSQFDGIAKLEWMRSPSSNILGYRIYYGTNNTFLNPTTVGDVTNCTLSVEEDAVYYFACAAYDNNLTESPWSNIVTNYIQPRLHISARIFDVWFKVRAGTNIFQVSTNMATWLNVATNILTSNAVVRIQRTNSGIAEYMRIKPK